MVYRVGSSPPYFPDDLRPDRYGRVAAGGVLGPDILIEAYQKGIFPWSGDDPIPWFSPDPRMVLRPRDFHASRTLRKELRSGRYTFHLDRDFGAVIRACASIPRAHEDSTWILPNVIAAYSELHARGIAHSVEVYLDEELAGGLYGLTFGRAFFGESMFSLRPSASTLALHTLCEWTAARDFDFIDCQAPTPHLARVGARPWPRSLYLRCLADTLRYPSLHQRWS